MSQRHSANSKLAHIYASLPLDAQQDLTETCLVQLLDFIPKKKARRILSSATRLKTRYAAVPVLDLRAKKKEMAYLINGLKRDAKVSGLRDRSRTEELLTEAIESLIDWANLVWRVVYEHSVNFELAHSCLLFAVEVLHELGQPQGGCKCSFMNMFMTASITSKGGKAVKSFAFTGANNIEQVLLWVWRELFVSLLSTGKPREKKMIPDMLADIDDIMGWQSLERLLTGGKISEDPFDDQFNEDEEADEDTEDEDEELSDGSACLDGCDCRFYAHHWPRHIKWQRGRLRELVRTRLMSIFRVTPSFQLFNALMNPCSRQSGTKSELYSILSSIATNSSDNFATALSIHVIEENVDEISTLLDSHSHLLRPRDAIHYQAAITTLSINPLLSTLCLRTTEKELADTVRTISAALLTTFCNIGKEEHKEEINKIVKLRPDSEARHDRIVRWVEAIVTPTSSHPHPMAFAAMVMGMPVAPDIEDGDEADPLENVANLDDADLDDLKEEFRPMLKGRFEGWCDVAKAIKGGPLILAKTFSKLIEAMPFMKAPDVVEEMIGRIEDKPSKHHICDALEALSAFARSQRKALLRKSKQKKQAEARKQAQAKLQSTPARSSSQSAATPKPGTPSNSGRAAGTSMLDAWNSDCQVLDEVD